MVLTFNLNDVIANWETSIWCEIPKTQKVSTWFPLLLKLWNYGVGGVAHGKTGQFSYGVRACVCVRGLGESRFWFFRPHWCLSHIKHTSRLLRALIFLWCLFHCPLIVESDFANAGQWASNRSHVTEVDCHINKIHNNYESKSGVSLYFKKQVFQQ